MNNAKVTGIAQHFDSLGLCELDLFFDNKMVLEIMRDEMHLSLDNGKTFCSQLPVDIVSKLLLKAKGQRTLYKTLIGELGGV